MAQTNLIYDAQLSKIKTLSEIQKYPNKDNPGQRYQEASTRGPNQLLGRIPFSTKSLASQNDMLFFVRDILQVSTASQ